MKCILIYEEQKSKPRSMYTVYAGSESCDIKAADPFLTFNKFSNGLEPSKVWAQSDCIGRIGLGLPLDARKAAIARDMWTAKAESRQMLDE